MTGGCLVITVIDVDDLGAFLAHARVVPDHVGTTHAIVRRRVAEHQDEVCLASLVNRRGAYVLIGRDAHAVHEGHHVLVHAGRVVAVHGKVATQAVHQALGGASRRRIHAGGVVDVDRVVAVGLDRVLELVRDRVDGLVPADALELARPTWPRALHRVLQTIGMVDPLAHRAAAQAGSCLEVIVSRVVGEHVGDLAVPHMPLEDAPSSAVHVALAPDDLIVGRSMCRLDVVEQVLRRGDGTTCRGQHGECAAGLDEASSRKLWGFHCHSSSSLANFAYARACNFVFTPLMPTFVNKSLANGRNLVVFGYAPIILS